MTSLDAIAEALGSRVLSSSVLAGGFSHETRLVTLADRRVVARFGGADPAVEAAVMNAARPHVPVPEVLLVLPGPRPAMVIEFVEGTPLSRVFDVGGLTRPEAVELGAAVGRAAGGVSAVAFDRRGFLARAEPTAAEPAAADLTGADLTAADLTVAEELPWSQQLPSVARGCMAAAPAERLDDETRDAWIALCEKHAPALRDIDAHTRLVNADLNPKNILVSGTGGGWRVDALLDWEFGYSGCPYADAGNMARFGATYPEGFLDGFRAAFAEAQPLLLADWAYLGRVLDMFALSDLTTRAPGHEIADLAATRIREWSRHGVPGV